MDWLPKRHRRAIQSASLAFACTLMIVVAALGIFDLEAPGGGSTATTSGTSNQLYVRGPISTFPASWTDGCGYFVQGNETTTNGVNPNGYGLNINLSQVYSKIVGSSAFQTLAAGRTWVTLDWGIGQQGSIDALQTFVAGDFLFVSGGVPDADGYAQIDYFVEGGNVTVVSAGPFLSTCVQDIAFRNGANLLGNGTYAVGQPVGINFTFRNLTNASMTITASTPCLANFTVIQGGITNGPNSPQWPSGPVVYDSAKHAGCTGPPLKVVLNPGQFQFPHSIFRAGECAYHARLTRPF